EPDTVPQTPKAGTKNAPRRTFVLGEDPAEQDAVPERRYKSHPKKYDHFEFVDPAEDDTPIPVAVPPKRISVYDKKGSSWDFEDFVTPEKKPTKARPQEERHFGWSDDEVEPSPVKQPRKLVPRRDAETHFEMTDESPEKKPLENISNIENRPHK